MGGRGSGLRSQSFHMFGDTPSGTHEYTGDGHEQDQFFRNNSNYDELIRGMTEAQRYAFRDRWAPGWFMRGQQYGGWDNMGHTDKVYTQTFDDILDKATLKTGVVVTRLSDAQLVLGAGRKTATLEELKAAEGSIVTSKGNMSFGAAKHGLTIGQRGKNVEYQLKIPGGSKGAGMWIGDRRINPWGQRQREFMTNRDTAYKVGKTTYDHARDVFVTEIEWVGRQKHDYGTSGRV